MKNTTCRGRRPRRPVRRIISLILSLIMLSSITAGLDFSAYALASSGSCGNNITWTFNSSTGLLTISGTGKMEDYQIYFNSPFYNKTEIKKVIVNSGVTSIGEHTFSNCSNITNITIPTSVTNIGRRALYGCRGLTSISIPNSVTTIESEALGYCSNLTSISIPNSVTSIENKVFCNCSGLTSITVASGNTKYDSRNNCNAIIQKSNNSLIVGCKNTVVPNDVVSIGNAAFYGSAGLTNLTIPNSVKSIGEEAFYDCSKINSITLPDSIISIGNSAFKLCGGITTIIIPNGVTSIGNSAFSYCNIKSITIPDSVTSIGDSAFYHCPQLKYVYFIGLKTKWNKVNIGSENDCLLNAVILCNDGAINCTHTYDNGIITTQPTCVKTGVKTFTCMVCGNIKTETIPATGVHSYNNGTITTQPTCTKPGVKKYECINCTNSYTETVPALGHNYTERVSKAATCTESGIKTYTCSRCNNSYTATVNALGHNYKTTVIKATPDDYGYSDTTCSRCGDQHYKEIPSVNAKLSKTSYYYNGKSKKPKVTVYNDYGSTISTEHYNVVYPKGRKKIGKYTVKIVFKGDYYSGTIKKTFKIVKKVKKPAQVKGVSSVIYVDDYNAKVTYAAKWKKVKGASGYQLQFGGEDGGGRYWTGTKTLKGSSNTSYKTNCAYGSSEAWDCYAFVKVRAYKKVNGKKVYGKWSKIVDSKRVNI